MNLDKEVQFVTTTATTTTSTTTSPQAEFLTLK